MCTFYIILVVCEDTVLGILYKICHFEFKHQELCLDMNTIENLLKNPGRRASCQNVRLEIYEME